MQPMRIGVLVESGMFVLTPDITILWEQVCKLANLGGFFKIIMADLDSFAKGSHSIMGNYGKQSSEKPFLRCR